MVAMTKIEGAEAVEPKRRWSVVVSKPNAERLAKQHLENQGFEVYLPMVISERAVSARSPRGGLICRAFFPSILFLRIDPTIDGWRSVFSTVGVKSMYLAGERPAVVADKHIDAIRAHEENGFIKLLDPETHGSRFVAGQKVKVRWDLADLDATFVEPIDKNRASILLNLLGRESPQVVSLISLK